MSEEKKKKKKEIEEKVIEKIKTERWFFEKINKTDKPWVRLIQKNRGKSQINKIRNEKEVNQYHKTKDHKGLIWTIMCQSIGQTRRNG